MAPLVKSSTWWPARLAGDIHVDGVKLMKVNAVADSFGVPKSRVAAAAARDPKMSGSSASVQ